MLKRSESVLRCCSGAARISQDLRRGSTAAEDGWSATALPEQDLVRRSSGWDEEDSMPARRSVRQDAQKPVMGLEG